MLPLVAVVVVLSSPVLHTYAGTSSQTDGAVSHPHQSQADDVFLKALIQKEEPLNQEYDGYSQPALNEATLGENDVPRKSVLKFFLHQRKPTKNISVPTSQGEGQNKRPDRSKRVRVCPFLNRVGFPLGGCLYSYIKPVYKPPRPTPKPAARPKPIPRPVIMWQPYQARWPEFYFLGGALGRR